jgi:hypothetical protein
MSEPRSHRIFRAALQDLADAPTRANVGRYLIASRLLDRSIAPRATPAGVRTAARTGSGETA